MSGSSMTAGVNLSRRLAEGASQLGMKLNDSQQAKLLRYLELLDRWNDTYNLSAIRGQEAMLTQHVLDSLAIVPSVGQWAGGRLLRLLDAGSGAGLPGVVLAIVRPDWLVTTVDAVAKKAAFVRQVVGELELPNLQPIHGRVEKLALAPKFDLIVSRAFASLAEFVAGTQALVAPNGVWVAMKGQTPTEEIESLTAKFAVFHVERLDVPGLAAARCLVWIRPN